MEAEFQTPQPSARHQAEATTNENGLAFGFAMPLSSRRYGRNIIRILLVEDNPDLSRRLAEGLEGAGFVVEHAADGKSGYRLGRMEEFDAAILDLGLPDMPGVELLRSWRQAGREMLATPRTLSAAARMSSGATRKPVTPSTTISASPPRLNATTGVPHA